MQTLTTSLFSKNTAVRITNRKYAEQVCHTLDVHNVAYEVVYRATPDAKNPGSQQMGVCAGGKTWFPSKETLWLVVNFLP